MRALNDATVRLIRIVTVAITLCDRGIGIFGNMQPLRVEHPREQAAIGQRRIVAVTVASRKRISRQQPLESRKSHIHPMPMPFVMPRSYLRRIDATGRTRCFVMDQEPVVRLQLWPLRRCVLHPVGVRYM